MSIQSLDFSTDIMRSLLWQYNDAPVLESLVRQKDAWYLANQAGFWDDWITDVFDLRTANDFGLAVWAIILDVPIVVSSQSDGNKLIWGFESTHANFNNGNFSNTDASSGLTMAQRRLILQLRYFQLTTRGTVPEINRILDYLFGDLGGAYVVDGLEMNALYVFKFNLSSDFQTVLDEFDLLPRPAGVGVEYVSVLTYQPWGFGSYRSNFGNGNFYV